LMDGAVAGAGQSAAGTVHPKRKRDDGQKDRIDFASFHDLHDGSSDVGHHVADHARADRGVAWHLDDAIHPRLADRLRADAGDLAGVDDADASRGAAARQVRPRLTRLLRRHGKRECPHLVRAFAIWIGTFVGVGEQPNLSKCPIPDPISAYSGI
jgi:hypothetical protein